MSSRSPPGTRSSTTPKPPRTWGCAQRLIWTRASAGPSSGSGASTLTNRSRPEVCVLGLGYVGLPLCIVLARAGRAVVGVDVQDWIVDALRAGRFPFEEPPMEEAFRHPAVRENFEACSEPRTADVFVIAVPTPLDGLTRTADLTFVANAARSLIPFLEPDILVVVESTVPPLTCREVIAPILAESGLEVGREILLAHCPERILPGDIMREIVENDRVIGGVTPEAARRAGALYASFVEGSITETDDVTAEMCKLMENTYRDVNVALANELASVLSVSASRLSKRFPWQTDIHGSGCSLPASEREVTASPSTPGSFTRSTLSTRPDRKSVV